MKCKRREQLAFKEGNIWTNGVVVNTNNCGHVIAPKIGKTLVAFFGGFVLCDVVFTGDVMVKCSESIVVVHSGLAAKQCVGTRGHPATVTDKTALVLSPCGGLGRGLSDRRHTLQQCDHSQTGTI